MSDGENTLYIDAPVGFEAIDWDAPAAHAGP
jgi:hypothetical protein